ncbi:MAG: S-adenosylmethionine decarboxylase [Flavobacteriales bacterium]|nr:S-adenosylmethionine decarboxylase [Flavobacteriales bacterium]
MEAKLYNYQCWVKESRSDELKKKLADLLSVCEFEVLGFMEHHFKPQGYTCIWLLGESHLAVHTYPEHNSAYIELTSCIASKNIDFQDRLKGIFEVSLR